MFYSLFREFKDFFSLKRKKNFSLSFCLCHVESVAYIIYNMISVFLNFISHGIILAVERNKLFPLFAVFLLLPNSRLLVQLRKSVFLVFTFLFVMRVISFIIILNKFTCEILANTADLFVKLQFMEQQTEADYYFIRERSIFFVRKFCYFCCLIFG